VITRTNLIREFSRYALKDAIDNGVAVSVLPGVFAHAECARTFETRVAALGVWLPQTCVVSGLAALSLLGLTDETIARFCVVAPRHAHVRGPDWVRVARTGAVRTREVRQGVMCAARERAVIDAWVESDPAQRTSVVLEAMRRCNLRGSAVLRELARLPRVKGRRELVALLNEASDGIESFLEHRARRTVLNTPDFHCLKRQVEITAMGRTYKVDTLHEASKTIIEFDGAKVHGTRDRKKLDSARDAALATLGYITVRIGYDDVMTRPAWCREVIRRVIAARSGGPILL